VRCDLRARVKNWKKSGEEGSRRAD
jgi:hypothetical protein